MNPAWLPASAFRFVRARRVRVVGEGVLVDTVRAEVSAQPVDEDADLVFALGDCGAGPEGFTLASDGAVVTVRADEPAGLLYGLFHLVRLGEAAFAARPLETHRPALRRRMVEHWDNVDVHPVMGQVERGYAGGSIFWRDGALRADLDRVRGYGRLLASCGVNALAVNNVNVHRTEARLLTDRLGDVAAIADRLRPFGIRVHL